MVKGIALAALLLLVWVAAWAGSGIVYHEGFTDGRLGRQWQTFPGFGRDPIEAVAGNTPEGDGWIGRVTNRTLGGFAALAYTGPELRDAVVEAWVYTVVTAEDAGPLNGIAIRVDPTRRRFYRLAAHFFGDAPKLTLAYVGQDTRNYPVYLRTWDARDLMGGLPGASGWHRMKLQAIGDRLSASWDGHELPGGPVVDGRIASGYAGVYANFVGVPRVGETFVDGFTVKD